MLYALRQPLALLALVLGFGLGVTVRGLAQAALARDRRTGRRTVDPRRHLDPFGAVAAAIAGVGWGAPREAPPGLRRGRGRQAAVLLAGPVALLLAGSLLLAGYLAAGGARFGLAVAPLSSYLRGGVVPASAGHTLLLLAGMELLAMGVLALVPLPPLDGGRLLFLLGPRSLGWQRAQYQLDERNIGLAIVLALLLLPLAGGVPLLLFIVDTVLDPLLRLVAA